MPLTTPPRPNAGMNGASEHPKTRGEYPPSDRPRPGLKERLFFRTLPAKYADLPPKALPRDPEGVPRRRPTIDDYPVPDAEKLLETYRAALASFDKVIPLRAAVLRDHLHRVEAAQARFRIVRQEEIERQQGQNDDTRSADDYLEQRIDDLKAARAGTEGEHERTVVETLEVRGEARRLAVVAQTAAGHDLSHLLSSFKKEESEHHPQGRAEEAESADEGAPLADEETADPVSASRTDDPPANPAPKPAGRFARAASLLRGLNLFATRRDSGSSETPKTLEQAQQAQTPRAPDLTAAAVENAARSGILPTSLAGDFSLEEGRRQARPKEAVALSQGLLYRSPAQDHAADKWAGLEWLALVVCGAIFGVSVGVLAGVLEPQRLQHRFMDMRGVLLVVSVLGMAVFWLLGRVVTLISSLTSEMCHASAVACKRDAPDTVGKWLGKAAWLSALLMVATIVGLVVIESHVERHGIMRTILDSERNNSFSQTAAEVAQSVKNAEMPEIAIWSVVLVISLPFVLLHALRGWIQTRASCFAGYIDAVHEKEAWEIAKNLHNTHKTRHAALEEDLSHFTRERIGRLNDAQKEDDTAAREASRTARQAAATPSFSTPPWMEGGAIAEEIRQMTPESPEREADAPPLQETVIDAAVDKRSGPNANDAIKFTDTGKILFLPGAVAPLGAREAVALSVTDAREAHFRVRRAYAQKRDALARVDAEIARWKSQRTEEKTELDTEGVRRIEDAHTTYVFAARRFDELFQEEMKRYERATAPSLLWWIYRILFAWPSRSS